jgi:hypothetical protein
MNDQKDERIQNEIEKQSLENKFQFFMREEDIENQSTNHSEIKAIFVIFALPQLENNYKLNFPTTTTSI